MWAVLDADQSLDAAPLERWMSAGGYLVASGDARAWAPILGWNPEACRSEAPENPYAAHAWVFQSGPPELIAPPGWPVSRFDGHAPGVRTTGTVYAVHGERQTPQRAVLRDLLAPAMILGQRYCFVNSHPFAALQAWLQGQEDLQPWLGWRHRLFWLDEWVSALASLLSGTPASPLALDRPGVGECGETTVILRHDVDHSRDRSYLDEETRRGVPGTFAVLRDGNTRFWLDTLESDRGHECAFHYNTGRRDWADEIAGRLRGSTQSKLAPHREAIRAHGLARQTAWAAAHGIGIASLHRHLTYLMYPEWVDSLDAVFAQFPNVRGASSLFRGQVLRWGADRVDGSAGTIGEWPDAQFPFWLPCKLAHAGDGGRMLRGWESASMMECEPELVDALVSHRIAHLPQRVLTLGYHPAHGAAATFSRDGSLAAFVQVLDVLEAHRVNIRTASQVFGACDAAAGVH